MCASGFKLAQLAHLLLDNEQYHDGIGSDHLDDRSRELEVRGALSLSPTSLLRLGEPWRKRADFREVLLRRFKCQRRPKGARVRDLPVLSKNNMEHVQRKFELMSVLGLFA